MNKLILIILIGYSLTNCQTKSHKAKSYPLEVIDKELISLFDNAKWEIYKWNLLEGETYYNGATDPKSDTLLSDFEKLDLQFEELIYYGDTVSFLFSFGAKIDPIKKDVATQVSFYDNKIIELGFRNGLSIIYNNTIQEEEFTEYLRSKEQSELNIWLFKEAQKRGIFPVRGGS